MAFDLERWRARVQQAATRGDGPELRVLYEQAKAELGHEVDVEWAHVLSALDANAITG